MENGNAKERRIAQELELLKQYQRVSVKDLAATLEVSEMTIRRDLDLLRKNHVLERSYGYATLAKGGDGYAYDGEVYDLRLARIQNLSEKDRIAKYAATLIEPGDWIFLDNGTTVGRITSYLPTDFEFTVLCYNFTILAELSLGITCINAHIVDSKRALIDSSAQNIMLADSSKFDLVKANHFAELHDMDMLITDNKLSLDWRDFLNNAQINLKLV